MSHRFLEFSLGNEKFALPLLEVKEVIPAPETTPIPKSPDYFTGIMNLRGQVITVLDLRKKVGLKKNESSHEESAIILNISDLNIGVIVDSINRVINANDDCIKEVQQEDGMKKRNGVKSIIQFENEMILLIDPVELLELDRIQIRKTQSAA
jgi:purine-binding chemotaxis protein CheW